MMTFGQPISRRTVLRGLGTTMALPLMDAMLPTVASAAAASAAVGPKRAAFIYIPQGTNMTNWWPAGSGGRDYELSRILQPLESLKDDMLVLGGLTCDKARANGDGGGDHARSGSSWLTGTQARKTATNFHAGISIDQVMAQHVGRQTRIPSLEMSFQNYRGTGSCDSGYSCVYEHTLAWSGPTSPLPSDSDPRVIFNRLFAARANDPNVIAQNQIRASILDAVQEDARDLQRRVGGADLQKLDQYFTNVREMEQRIARSEQLPAVNLPAGTVAPEGAPADFTEKHNLLADIMALAFQTDVTRVITCMYGKEGSDLQYRMLGLTTGHHTLSHHQNNPRNLEQITQITIYHIQRLAYFIEKLKSIPEGNGTVLDNSMIVFGSGISDPNQHLHHNLPTLVFGKGGGTINTGRYVVYPRETPITNLWLALAQRMGVQATRLGDSTGILGNL